MPTERSLIQALMAIRAAVVARDRGVLVLEFSPDGEIEVTEQSEFGTVWFRDRIRNPDDLPSVLARVGVHSD